METLKQCSERVWQLQSRIAELEQENARLQAENIHLQAENQTLRASSARFRAVFEQSPLSIQMLSPDGRIQQVNRAWEQLFDSTPREIGDYNMLAKQVMTLIERGLAGEVVILPPIRYDVGQNVAGGADGRAPWAHGILYPIKDEVGHVVEVVLVHQDTTDWLRVEQTRREAEAEKQAAILLERERAALERVAELAKANDTLSQTLEVLATDSDLNNFLGHVLKVIAQQLDAPLTEYWFHPEPGNIAYLGLSCLQGQILTPAEQPGHPGVVGFPVPTEMIHGESLHHRQRHFVIEDATTNAPIVENNAQIGVDTEQWCAERGVRKQLNVPLRLGEKSIGGLLIWIPGERHFTEQQIELAYALAQLVTLAIHLTQLAEQARLAAIAKEHEKAAVERVAELAKANSALAGTCARLANQPDLSAFLGYVVLEAVAQLKADAGVLSILNEQRGVLQGVAHVQHGQLIPIEPLAAEITIDEAEFYRILLETRKPRFFDLETESHLFWAGAIEFHRQHNHRAVLAVPLFADGKLFGHFGLAFTQNEPISEQGMELVQALAHQATLAIQLMQLAESAKLAAIVFEQEQAALERSAELALANDALRRSVGHLTTTDSLNSFLVAVLQEAIQASGAVSAAVFVYNPSENTLLKTTLVLHGSVIDIATDPRTEIWRSPVPADLTNAWQMMLQRRMLWIDNDNPEPEHWPMSIAWHHQFGHKTIAAIPLVVGEQTLGFLGLCFATHQQPSESKVEQCRALAQHAALALRMSQLAEEAKLAAIAKEQEKAALERAAELTELNAALSASEARLRTLFEQIPVSLQIFSSSGVCLEVNRAWSELWQLPSSAVIGKSCLVTSENPSSQLPSPFTPYLQRCFAGEPVVVPPLWFDPVTTFKVGRARWVQTYIYPIKDQANGLREVLLIHQDIHALKQASEVALGQTEALIQVLSALVSSPDIDQLLAKVISITTAQLNAPASTLWLCDTQTGANKLHLVCCGDQVSRELPVRMLTDIDSLCLLLDSPTWQQIERNRRPIVLTDIATHPALEHLRPWLMQQQVRALMLVPLVLDNQLIGCVGIHNSTSNYFRSEEIELAQALAHQITLAIQLTQLAQQAKLTALLEERNRIAGEIHDTLAQTFTGISLQLDVAQRLLSVEPIEAHQILARVSELAQVGLTQARRSVWTLYSPTTQEANLAQSLRHSLEQMTNDTAVCVEFNLEGTPCSLSMDVSQNLLRMGQEAVTNILKHAQASTIWIELVYEAEYVCLSVRDDGRGFVLSAANTTSGASFGLIGMYQRAERIGGQLTITTQPGQGTEIFVRVPVS